MDYFLWEFSRGLYCSHGDHLIASKTFENFTKLASSDVYTLLVLSKFTNDIKLSSSIYIYVTYVMTLASCGS